MSGPHVDHIGIIVADLDAATRTFEVLFGAPPKTVKTLKEVGLRVAEFEAANVTIELIQYLEEGESFARSVMGGREGINHLSLRVDDVETSIRALEGAGIKTMEGFPTRGAHGKVAFFDAATTHGLLFEVREPD
jgi:methylmalonyl-CoA/ethylmalonyl-CoA epimerase